VVDKLPEYRLSGFDKDYFIQWCVWLFFYLIPEHRGFELLKIFGVFSSFALRGYVKGTPNGKDKDYLHLNTVKRIAVDYSDDARDAVELPDLDTCKSIMKDMKAVYASAEYVDGIDGKRRSEFVILLHGANLLGIGFRSFYLLVVEKQLKLYRNSYHYLFIRRDDLTKLL